MAAGPAMDAGAGVSAPTAAADGAYGLARIVAWCSSSPLFFWLLTVVLVAAIHIASGSRPSGSR